MATTMKTISAALKLVDAKKENLRKAFEDLQSHSSPLSSTFATLTWPDLDSYFSSLHSTLQHKFQILQSQLQQHQQSNTSPKPDNSPNSQPLDAKEGPARVPARPELISLCEKMDGLGLRNYVLDRPKERNTLKAELADALGHAPDAAAMVLEAMEGFYGGVRKGITSIAMKRSCVVLLEGLRRWRRRVGGEIVGEMREKARDLAAQWKGKASTSGGDYVVDGFGFFTLVAAYGVADGFDVGELVDLGVEVVRYKEAAELFRTIGFRDDNISDIILKLIGQGKQLEAARFILEFELSAKFPLVPLLEEYVKESKRLAKKVLKDKNCTPKSLKESFTKEANAYKSVIKLIEDCKLGSEFLNLKEKIMKRLETVKKLKSDRKSYAAAPASRTQQQSKPQKLSGSKRPRDTAPARPTTISMSAAATSSTVPGFQQSHPQPAGLLAQHLPPYSGSLAGPYGLAGSTPAFSSYAGSSAAGLYGLTGAPFGDPGNFMPSQTHVMPSQTQAYSSELHMATGHYDRPVAYGGYAFQPQYHQPYHPQ